MNVWIALMLMAVAALIGVAAGRWNGRNALDAEYDAGYEDGLARATEDLTAQLDAADHAYLRTQELDVPRPHGGHLARENGTGDMRSADPEIAGPGHTIYAELTPEALGEDLPQPGHSDQAVGVPEWPIAGLGELHDGDAGFQLAPVADDFLSRLSDDEFWRVAPLWLAAARGLADAPWRPLPAWSAPMLERAA